MATGYPYERLPLDPARRQIRVLSFRKEVGACKKPLRCKLALVDLEDHDNVQYFAISYAWGDVSERRAIYIDGYDVNVPANAYAALEHISGDGRDSVDAYAGELCLWIDSVCISQHDTAERNQQVSMMSEIFSHASSVLVWLGGDENILTEETFAVINEINCHCSRATQSFEKLHETLFRISSDRRWQQYNVKHDAVFRSPFGPASYDVEDRLYFTDYQWALLQQLYESPWFARNWVVQEYAVAKRSICFYGRQNIPTKHVLRAARWLWYGEYHYQIRKNIRGIQCASLIYDIDRGEKLFWNLLRRSINFDCTEPRDKVFSVYGIINDGNRGVADKFSAVRPNYYANLTEVYRDATRAAILIDQSLAPLGLANRLETRPDEHSSKFPTWVPRYDQNRRPRISMGTFIVHGRGLLPDHVEFDTACTDPNILAVRGIVIDVVDKVGQGYYYGNDTDRWDVLCPRAAQAIHRSWKLAQQHVKDCHVDELLQDVFLTSICNCNSTANEACKDLDFMQRLRHFIKDWKIDGERPLEQMEDETFSQGPVYEALRRNGLGRAFLLTSHRRLMGMGPNDMQAGDKVCHLFGEDRPYILRQDEQGWKLLGDTYLHRLSEVSQPWAKTFESRIFEPQCRASMAWNGRMNATPKENRRIRAYPCQNR
jgi:hypothetical protein